MTAKLGEVLSIDVREIPGAQRHRRIFGTLETLEPGEVLHIIVDHDPIPLRMHLDSHFTGLFGWEYLEHGPLWKVELKRLKHDGCGCSCGGHH
ncbi:DUF2249 domain-containing protein [Aliirhizobium smilacinae]|uniref:DUF2249 domain-containing protein n=1 Tax=Aliirhizobium smilacinae TaxID=1395944 RepID=A0A5C4XEJ9_9HYPH|nr:DUF2249 domain-containing protein [Rhizobium smilacinae]TNM61802.1 DUF2249 domain-containing protein [Rhizobium smilacinae]